MNKKYRTCRKPDKDIPEMICGHQVPCPYHTVIIKLNEKPVPTITYPVTVHNEISPNNHKKLKEIAKIIKELSK